MKKITVRLPEELHDRLVEVSRRETRSINSTVLVAVEGYCEGRYPSKGQDAQEMSDLDALFHDM